MHMTLPGTFQPFDPIVKQFDLENQI